MLKIDIKPLSVNECWQGRKYKTKTYNSYETELSLKLPVLNVPNVQLGIDVVFGFSSRNSDIDNPLKPFLDVLQNKYKFNDRDIYSISAKKEIVKKGGEFIKFNIFEI